MGGGCDRKPGGGNPVNETFHGAAPVPGRRTLTEQLPPRPVQRTPAPLTPAPLTPTEHVVQRLSETLSAPHNTENPKIVVDKVQSDGRIAIRDPGERTPTIVTAEQLRGMVPTGDAVFSFPEKKQ